MWAFFWDWLSKLPQSSASFLGSLTGSSVGLLAILLGALFNARLNRRRDDRLREEDRVAVASTLYAELQGIHRALVENAEHLQKTPPPDQDGFVVPEPSIKLLPETLSKIGLLRPETIRKVMDAYVLTEQYVAQLILLGGALQPNMPEDHQAVYSDAKHAKFVIEFNQARAGVVKEAMNALSPYLK
jgi:hypothetical protein